MAEAVPIPCAQGMVSGAPALALVRPYRSSILGKLKVW